MENLAKMSPNGDYLKTNETLSIALNEIPELRVEMREGFLNIGVRLAYLHTCIQRNASMQA